MRLHKAVSKKPGFTVIEVSLFLAVSGLLMVGTILATNGVLARQRYNDAINNFADFFRNTYDSTINIQSDSGSSGGTSLNKALYGYVVTIEANQVNSYLLTGTPDVDKLGDNVLTAVQNNRFSLGASTAYSPLWSTQIKQSHDNLYHGSLIIMRSPVSGGVITMHSPATAQNELFRQSAILEEDLVICLVSEDSNIQRGIKISAGGSNASAVSILNAEDGAC